MKTTKERAALLLKKLTNDGDGVTDEALLDYILFEYLKDYEALAALISAEEEFFHTQHNDKEHDLSSFDESED